MPYTALMTANTMLAPVGHCRPHTKTAVAPLHILLVEDDASDIMLTEIALNATQVDYELHTLHSGAEVLPYLRGLGKYRNEPKPDILMLDLSLPTTDGFEILAEIAERSEQFGEIPIVILTGDTHCAFLRHSYSLNILSYLTKPCSVEKMQDTLVAVKRHKK